MNKIELMQKVFSTTGVLRFILKRFTENLLLGIKNINYNFKFISERSDSLTTVRQISSLRGLNLLLNCP